MTIDSKKILAQNLKTLLVKNKINQAKLCSDLNIKPTTLSDWVNGKTYPRIDSLEKISDYFGLSVSHLIKQDNCSFSADIAQKLDEMLSLLEEKNAADNISFNGKSITHETLVLIKITLENTVRLINEIVQKSF